MKKIAKAIKTVLIAVISLIINIVTFPIQGIVLLVFTLTKQPDKMYEQMLDDAYEQLLLRTGSAYAQQVAQRFACPNALNAPCTVGSYVGDDFVVDVVARLHD